MKRMKLTWVVLLTLLILSVAAMPLMAQTPKKGGTLNVALWQGFQTLDWQSTTAHPTPQGMMSVWEGLYAIGKDLSPVPDLAESVQISDDQKTWTFNLRRGVLFHNGKEMTSDDVKASLERWMKLSPRGKELGDVKEIRTQGKYTIQIILNQPQGVVLLLVLANQGAKAVIMPKEIADASPKEGELTEIIGTGPYMFDQYRPDNFLRLKRFEDYVARTDPPNYEGGKKVAYPDRIIYWIVPARFFQHRFFLESLP